MSNPTGDALRAAGWPGVTMGVHDLKQTLMAEHAGVTGLIMQYEPGGTGREIYTATVDGKNVPVTVDPNLKPDQIIAAILTGVKQQETTNDIPDSQVAG